MKKKQIKNLSLKKFTISKLNNPQLIIGGFAQFADASHESCSLRTRYTRGSKCCHE